MATRKVYWEDDDCHNIDAVVVGIEGDRIAFDRTCFYPGGGGQPPDEGSATIEGGGLVKIVGVAVDPGHVIWHTAQPAPDPAWLGRSARLVIDAERRTVLARYHTVLHILNTIALRDHGAWITGAQIGIEYSRIDFCWDGFSTSVCGELERKVNEVVLQALPISAFHLPEEEFTRRPDLLRTLEVKPPVIEGRVRVVSIDGFDAQACGGTHVHSTGELGRFTIYGTENKGRINKRLYVRLDRAMQPEP